MALPKIHIILTGGTVDMHYNPPTGTNQMNGISIVPSYLENSIKPHLDLSLEVLSMVESTDFTDDMRDALVKAIEKVPVDKILITHGTDRMAEMARYLNGKVGDKTVILTGSMIPLKEFAMSDAGFNIGFALAELLSKPAGVYLSMHAKSFAPDQVLKNFDIARFEEK